MSPKYFKTSSKFLLLDYDDIQYNFSYVYIVAF